MAVQLTGEEITCVWLSMDTRKILGFAPQNCRLPGMERSLCIPLMHAHEVDRWANEFRAQQAAEFEEKQYKKFMKDSAVRKAIREKLRARMQVVQPKQRADIERGLKMLDALEARIDSRHQQGALLVEMYDSSKRKEDIALESPAYQTPKPVC